MSCINIPNPFSKGAPEAPDYQGASNQATLNSRPNQSTPFASSSWARDPRTGAWSQNTGLAPGLNQANQSMMGQLGGAWSSPLDNGAQARQRATEAMYGQAASRLNPMWDQRQHDMNVELSQQGIDPNSAAYGKQQDVFSRGRNDAYNQALYSAITGGGQEAQRQQQMDLTSRFAPLQGMQGLQGLSQMPGFQTGGDPLRAAGLQGNYALEGQAMNNKFWNDIMKKIPLPGQGGGGGN